MDFTGKWGKRNNNEYINILDSGNDFFTFEYFKDNNFESSEIVGINISNDNHAKLFNSNKLGNPQDIITISPDCIEIGGARYYRI